jgi:hypothetical protein
MARSMWRRWTLICSKELERTKKKLSSCRLRLADSWRESNLTIKRVRVMTRISPNRVQELLKGTRMEALEQLLQNQLQGCPIILTLPPRLLRKSLELSTMIVMERHSLITSLNLN